jgi:RNA polymerase subunit RPABC4/transcription elongation factor Spt4
MPENKYYCQNCGAEIKSTDTMCPKCGKNLSEVGKKVLVTVTDTISLSDEVKVSQTPEQRTLGADKKILGAEYHLKNMKNYYITDEKSFIYELEAFVTKISSIPDALLEDYNLKFGLGIGLDERNFRRAFGEKVKILSDKKTQEKAENFLNWWKAQKAKFESDPLVKVFFDKRHISIHRTELRADLKKIALTETINVEGTVKVIKRDKYGNIYDDGSLDKTESEKSKLISPKPKTDDSKTEWCFKDYPSENILDASQKLLEIMKQFVLDAKAKFP